MKTFYPESHI